MICQPNDSTVLASKHRWIFNPWGGIIFALKVKLFEDFAVPEIQFYRNFHNFVTFNIN